MAESTSLESATSSSYPSSGSTSFAAEIETGILVKKLKWNWSQHKSRIIVRSTEITYLGGDSEEEEN